MLIIINMYQQSTQSHNRSSYASSPVLTTTTFMLTVKHPKLSVQTGIKQTLCCKCSITCLRFVGLTMI